jgi:hypothetical protein
MIRIFTAWYGAALAKTSRFLACTPSPAPFVVLRIGIVLCLLAKAWVEFPNLLDLYGNRGIVQWQISDAVGERWAPRIGVLAGLLRDHGIDENRCVYLVFGVQVFSLLALLVGWQSRIAAALAWFSHLMLLNSGLLTAYGVDEFANIALFYCVVMPVGAAASLDALLDTRPRKPINSAGPLLRLLQLHVCIVYLVAGVSKARGEQWWNGEAIWRAVMQPEYCSFDMGWLARMPWLAMLAGWGTLLVEIGYAAFIWPRRTRPIWLLATVGMHLGIGIFMGLWLFSAVMIVLNVSAFGSDWVSAFARRFVRQSLSRSETPYREWPWRVWTRHGLPGGL